MIYLTILHGDAAAASQRDFRPHERSAPFLDERAFSTPRGVREWRKHAPDPSLI